MGNTPSTAAIDSAKQQALIDKQFLLENSTKLKHQITCISNYIQEQSVFLASLKNSILKQTKLHVQLVHKLSLLDPSG